MTYKPDLDKIEKLASPTASKREKATLEIHARPMIWDLVTYTRKLEAEATRLQEIVDNVPALMDECVKAKVEVERLRAGLKRYADKRNWVNDASVRLYDGEYDIWGFDESGWDFAQSTLDGDK